MSAAVIPFQRRPTAPRERSGDCVIIILPFIRVERFDDEGVQVSKEGIAHGYKEQS